LEPAARHLADIALQRRASGTGGHYLVACAGTCGAGKTTTTRVLAKRINELVLGSSSAPAATEAAVAAAVVVPMDGFHWTRAELDTFPDPEEAHRRRGAPFAFDDRGFVTLLRTIATASHAADPSVYPIVYPTYDHKLLDPVTDGSAAVHPANTIVIAEGLYLHIKPGTPVRTRVPDANDGVWSDIATLADELWWIESQDAVAQERLAKRHYETGIAGTLEDARRRVRVNDSLNAAFVRETRIENPHVV
ncbi:hypothetical protein GQ42DRAFT_102828, partial [Ramicandelaber brevisporus]